MLCVDNIIEVKGENMKRRLLNKVYARLRGHFWLPCPICGQMFGGHEWGGSLKISTRKGAAVCLDCKEEADRRNRENFGFISKRSATESLEQSPVLSKAQEASNTLNTAKI